MIVQAQYDYSVDWSNEQNVNQLIQQQQLLSFRHGALIDVVRSSGGWSYGKVIQHASQDDLFKRSDVYSTGWFPTNYAVPYYTVSESNETAKQLDNTHVASVVSEHTEEGDDVNDGFFATPMGGYIETEESSNDRNTPRQHINDDRDIEILPPGVTTVPVPDKRQYRIITTPKNLVTNIATTASKVTNRIVGVHRWNHPNSTTTTTSPAVYVSPS